MKKGRIIYEGVYMSTILNDKDEMTMSLVHYFVTEENYSPINVQGAKNEIWLENLDGPYKIIRINSKYIHNEEQYRVDVYRLGYVVKQIKKKTLSLKMNVLNICLDLNDTVDVANDDKLVETIHVSNIKEVRKNTLLGKVYPNIKTNSLKTTDDINDIIHVTEDINKKTTKENTKYEDIFRPKKIVVTKVLIIICVIMFLISLYLSDNFSANLLILGANNRQLVLDGEIWRLITNAFLHGNYIHLFVNMYSLWIVGKQVETYMGRTRMLAIYLLSALMGGLFSNVFLENSISVGASGAIFGLMGSLLYFGYHYRLYLSNALITQIVPIIILNLALGFTTSGIDNACHVGGLIGGYLSTMIVGVKYKSKNSEKINGCIVYFLLVAFLIYILLKVV